MHVLYLLKYFRDYCALAIPVFYKKVTLPHFAFIKSLYRCYNFTVRYYFNI